MQLRNRLLQLIKLKNKGKEIRRTGFRKKNSRKQTERQEQLDKLIMQTRTEILANQGYGLDMSLLNCILSASHNDKEFEEVVKSSELRVIQLKKQKC